MSEAPAFTFEPDPDAPGWSLWELTDPTRFNGFFAPIHVRVDDGIARVRMTPRHAHSNLFDGFHGGALMAFADVALFGAARGLGVVEAGGAVTVDLSAQFIAAGALDVPVEARVELLRETGRLLFMRGLFVQDGRGTLGSFTGTLRKASPRPA